jgi:type II secretion system protein N
MPEPMTWVARITAPGPRAQRVLRWVGFPLFYLFCLAVFAKLTFPYDRLKQRIEEAYNSRQTDAEAARLELGQLGSYWLRGIQAREVKLVAPPPPAEPGSTKKPQPRVTEIERVHASVSLLPLLFGTVSVGFGADAFGGDIGGHYKTSSAERRLELELSDVDVGQVPLLVEIVELPIMGQLDGQLALMLPEGQLGKADGTIELRMKELMVGDGKAKIRKTIALPQLNAGQLTLKAKATEGRLQIEAFTIRGPDFELDAEGTIRLRDRFEASIADMTVSFKFLDAYRNKNDMTRGLFGAPDARVPGLFDMDSKNRQAKQADGSYRWRVSGVLGKLSFTPVASDGRQQRRAPRTRAATPGR